MTGICREGSNTKLFAGGTKEGPETWQDHGARFYDKAIGRWNAVDPLAGEEPGWSPYRYGFDSPMRYSDPTGMSEDWVEKNNHMMYDSRVTDQATATQFYGKGATYRANGYQYTSASGSSVELGDLGFFKENGKIGSASDGAAGAMASARSEANQVRSRYSMVLAAAGGMTADLALPDPSDLALPKWGVYAVGGIVAWVLIAKMEGEVESIMEKAGGPRGVQYSLRSTTSGAYTCYTCASGSMQLGIGEVWKYGETTTPEDRYTQNWLNQNTLTKVNEFYGTQIETKISEKYKIYGYYLQNGHLPPGNKIFR